MGKRVALAVTTAFACFGSCSSSTIWLLWFAISVHAYRNLDRIETEENIDLASGLKEKHESGRR